MKEGVELTNLLRINCTHSLGIHFYWLDCKGSGSSKAGLQRFWIIKGWIAKVLDHQRLD